MTFLAFKREITAAAVKYENFRFENSSRGFTSLKLKFITVHIAFRVDNFYQMRQARFPVSVRGRRYRGPKIKCKQGKKQRLGFFFYLFWSE